MNTEYVAPFTTAACAVLESMLNAAPTVCELSTQLSIFTIHQCNVVIGVTGPVQGSVIIGMSRIVADRIASLMLDQPVRVFDQLAASAIAELGNMTCGNALMHLAEAGMICDATPPTVVLGRAKVGTLSVPATVIPFSTQQGQIFLSVGLEKAARN